jgi:hypothetical protein
VFDRIDHAVEPGGAWRHRIRVGGRLLIYVVEDAGAADLPCRVDEALAQGVTERDAEGFNRFRLVLVSDHPDALAVAVEQAFASSAYRDERTHLHILEKHAIAGILENQAGEPSCRR